MVLPFASLVVAATLLLPVSATLPSFDVAPSCRGAALAGDGLDATIQRCLQEEQDARKELQGRWAMFPLTLRNECTVAASAGGDPSYVDLLECLNISRDAAEMRRQNPKAFE
jgi:hypothetical protein